jgi:hypothetical protein
VETAILFAAFAAPAPAADFRAFAPAPVPPGCTCTACDCGPACPCPIVCPPPPPAEPKTEAPKAPARYLIGGHWYEDHPGKPGFVRLVAPAPGVAAPGPFGAGSTAGTTAPGAAPPSFGYPAAARAGLIPTHALGAVRLGTTNCGPSG